MTALLTQTLIHDSLLHLNHFRNEIRLVTSLILGICTLEVLLMLVYYWHRVIPLSKEIEEDWVLAPPAWWGFGFYVGVFLLLAENTLLRIELASDDAPLNSGTFSLPVIAVLLVVTSWKMLNFYGRSLAKHYERLWGFPVQPRAETCPTDPHDDRRGERAAQDEGCS